VTTPSGNFFGLASLHSSSSQDFVGKLIGVEGLEQVVEQVEDDLHSWVTGSAVPMKILAIPTYVEPHGLRCANPSYACCPISTRDIAEIFVAHIDSTCMKG